MPPKRSQRLNEQFKREIAEIVQTEVADPRIGMVVVTGAKVAPDLSSAQIYVSIGGDQEEKKQETLEGLNAAAAFIRSQLGKRLTIRKIPQLRFQRDTSQEYANKIERLLAEVRSTEREPTDSDDT